MNQQHCEFPHPNSLVLKQSLEFPSTHRGKRTHSIPLYSLTYPLGKLAGPPLGQANTRCALYKCVCIECTISHYACELQWRDHCSYDMAWTAARVDWKKFLLQQKSNYPWLGSVQEWCWIGCTYPEGHGTLVRKVRPVRLILMPRGACVRMGGLEIWRQ